MNFIQEFDLAEPNDNSDQAVQIGPNAEIVFGFIGKNDSDYYTFEVEKAGYMEASSEEIQSELVDSKSERGLDIQYYLYNDRKETIGRQYYPPPATYLAPGKYYIGFQVSGDGGWNRLLYKFALHFYEAGDVGESNNTEETAYEVKVGTTIPVAYSLNDRDYYLLLKLKLAISN